MRYVLDLGYGVDSRVNFVLDGSTDYNTGRDVAGDPTVAEASIIAWALNEIAEGRILRSYPSTGHNSYTQYDGPTDGVAP